jgi:hypothetical protein
MKKEDVLQLWLDAEEENRKHTQEGDAKSLELKDKFSNEYDKLSLEGKAYVNVELINIAG